MITVCTSAKGLLKGFLAQAAGAVKLAEIIFDANAKENPFKVQFQEIARPEDLEDNPWIDDHRKP